MVASTASKSTSCKQICYDLASLGLLGDDGWHYSPVPLYCAADYFTFSMKGREG